jgi:hypothetical protein
MMGGGMNSGYPTNSMQQQQFGYNNGMMTGVGMPTNNNMNNMNSGGMMGQNMHGLNNGGGMGMNST